MGNIRLNSTKGTLKSFIENRGRVFSHLRSGPSKPPVLIRGVAPMPPSFGDFRLRFWQRGKRNSAWRVKPPHWGTPVYGHAGIVGFPSPFGHSCEKRNLCNPSVMGLSNTNELLYPSLEKRGKGRFYKHYFKIPLYPPLPKGDKSARN